MWKSGDLVALKGGGPVMTVAYTKAAAEGRGEVAFCFWFDGRQLQYADIDTNCLNRAPELGDKIVFAYWRP